MFYPRPRMSGIFYVVGLLGIVSAVVGLFIGVAAYFETQGVTKEDVKDAFIVAVATGLGSLLLLGLASILNVLHDIRREVARVAADPGRERLPASAPPQGREPAARAGRPRLYAEEA